MDRSHTTSTGQPRRVSRSQFHIGPIVWIAVLLVSWFVIVDWRALPDFVHATVSALQ